MSQRFKVFLAGLTIPEFALKYDFAEHTVRTQLSKGFCKWPRIQRDRTVDSSHPLYGTYKQMIARCYNIKTHGYYNYGGRGIKVCKEWLTSFDAFLADMGPRPSEDYTLDRIDGAGNYCKENCRWASRGIQAFNTKYRPGRGVRKMRQKWQVRLRYQNECIHVGTFKTKKEAILAWEKKCIDLYGFIPYK